MIDVHFLVKQIKPSQVSRSDEVLTRHRFALSIVDGVVYATTMFTCSTTIRSRVIQECFELTHA